MTIEVQEFISLIPEGPATGTLDPLVHSERLNALLGWMSVGVPSLVVVRSILSGGFLWPELSGAILAVTLLPP